MSPERCWWRTYETITQTTKTRARRAIAREQRARIIRTSSRVRVLFSTTTAATATATTTVATSLATAWRCRLGVRESRVGGPPRSPRARAFCAQVRAILICICEARCVCMCVCVILITIFIDSNENAAVCAACLLVLHVVWGIPTRAYTHTHQTYAHTTHNELLILYNILRSTACALATRAQRMRAQACVKYVRTRECPNSQPSLFHICFFWEAFRAQTLRL